MSVVQLTGATDTVLVDNKLYEWTPLTPGDTGFPVGFIGTGDRTVQVQGTFGAGGTVQLEGSLDGVNYYALRDVTGATLIFTSPGIRTVLENPTWVRPNCTGGDGTTAIDVLMNVRRNLNG